MNNILKDWVRNNSISALFITVFTILLGIVFAFLRNKLGWPIFVVALLAVFSIILIIIWLSYKNVLLINQTLADDIRTNYNQFIDRFKLGWIFSSEQLLEFESRLSNIEIWLITADLGEDKIGGFFQDCVTTNLEKQTVTYKYFVPDKLEIRTRVEQLRDLNNNHKNLSFIFLNDDFFFLVPRFDFSIYNPFNKQNSISRIAFMGIPDTEKKNQYHAKISDDFSDVLIGKLLIFVP